MLGRLLHRIDTSGSILFDEFMEICLYDGTDGFFGAGGVRPGEGGDFVTSPEVSPFFGALIGKWARSISDPSWGLVEVGAGSGSLLAPLVEALPDRDPWVVERSRSAREAVVELVPDALAVESVSQVGATNAVVIMNEVLDNVPAALVRRKAEGWAELAVDRDGDSLVLCEVDARQEVAQWADTFLSTLKPGNLGTVQLEAQRLVTEIFASFDGVGVCVIDYGGSGSDLAMLREEDVVRTYKRQRSGFDFLSDPGGTDITVDVNTDAIVSVAGRLGATTAVVSQRDFLIANGAKDELDRFATQESAAARDGDILRQLKARSDAVGLRALLEPAGFGSFRVVTMVREAGVPEASMEE